MQTPATVLSLLSPVFTPGCPCRHKRYANMHHLPGISGGVLDLLSLEECLWMVVFPSLLWRARFALSSVLTYLTPHAHSLSRDEVFIFDRLLEQSVSRTTHPTTSRWRPLITNIGTDNTLSSRLLGIYWVSSDRSCSSSIGLQQVQCHTHCRV